MSSLFDSFFGFIFWGLAYFRMRSADKKVHRQSSNRVVDLLSVAVNVFIIFIGCFFLTVGTYASVEGIIDEFRAGTTRGVFSCASNAL